MKAWREGLAENERRMMLLGGAVLLVALLYTIIWLPMQNHHATLQQQVAEQRKTLEWMRTHAAEARSLQASRPKVRPVTGQSLLGMIDKTARSAKLSDTVKRIQPDGSNAVRVWLEGAPFDVLSRWLGQLEQRHGIQIQSLNIERNEALGRVTARLTLESSV